MSLSTSASQNAAHLIRRNSSTTGTIPLDGSRGPHDLLVLQDARRPRPVHIRAALRVAPARGGAVRGAGLVYHPDGSVEAVRHTLAELSMRDGELARAVIFPPTEAES